MREVHLLKRHLGDLAGLSVVLAMQTLGVCLALRSSAASRRPWLRRLIWIVAASCAMAAFLAVALGLGPIERHSPGWVASWGRGIMMGGALFSVFAAAAIAVGSFLPHGRAEHSPARRNFLRAAQLALLGAPAVATGYGIFVERTQIKLREEDIRIPGLHPDLDGLRIVQLTDIHMSPFLSERELNRAIGIANDTRANLALVTGDLITSAADPLALCLTRLAGLRADAGIFGCMGNHEIYAETQDYTEREGARLGMRFLRSASEPLRFGNATLNLAGVDYQHLKEPYLVGAEKMVRPGALNVMLSHNPDVFPVAARQGWDLTIAGHTHGGQVRVEILRQDLNIARFFTPYVDGIYRDGASSIFVSRGIGTIGLPARLGAPPEVALLRLCRI